MIFQNSREFKSISKQRKISFLSPLHTSKSLDIKGKPFCIKAFLCFYVTRCFSNNNVFLRILVCFTWSKCSQNFIHDFTPLSCADFLIEPLEKGQVQPASVDIRLGNTFSVVEDSSSRILNLNNKILYKVLNSDTYILLPNQYQKYS